MSGPYPRANAPAGRFKIVIAGTGLRPFCEIRYSISHFGDRNIAEFEALESLMGYAETASIIQF